MPHLTISRCRFLLTAMLAVLAAGLAVPLAGCSSVEKAPPQPTSTRASRAIPLDVARIMRGTVASEAVLMGYQPVVVRGYGLVVNLAETGSRDIPPALRAHMLAEMSRRGIGSARAGLEDIKPEQMLDSPNTAIVIVEAVVPPGAVGRDTRRGLTLPGTTFDVRVYADPRTGTTSLEGGTLYTTELRPGPLTTGSRQAFALAEAKGPIFINPFAEPDALERDTIDRRTGVILGGGEAVKDNPIKLRLATPSHARAELLQSSINGYFPREPGQKDDTARGESDESITITVPPSYRESPDDFVELLSHATIRRSALEAVAQSVKRAVIQDPGAATAAAWRWTSMGQRALPIIRELYDYPEEQPRLAALTAGAKLNDGVATPHLIDMAKSGSPEVRLRAVALLQHLILDPRIDQALLELLDDPDVDVRISAYEALVDRGDPRIETLGVGSQRRTRFLVDLVPSNYPMLYISQAGEPRIAVFGGHDLELQRPMQLDAWSGRLLMKAEAGANEVDVYYRPDDGRPRQMHRAPANMDEFIRFLGHRTTVDDPEPGLGMTYAETVGALYQIWRDGSLKADFKAEQDRILAAIRRREQGTEIQERPEFAAQPSEEDTEPSARWLEGGVSPIPETVEDPTDPDLMEAPSIGGNAMRNHTPTP